MPLFDYRCEECDETFEFLARQSDENPDTCPGCGSPRLRRELSAFGVSSGPGGAGLPPGGCAPSG
jgi:putative FmdB family regulatory protein